MLLKKEIDWEKFPVCEKRGAAVYKVEGDWLIDENIPVFKDEGRDFVERWV